MARAPRCEKIGLKKGSWTPQEDQILVSYIKKNGHKNWRALPQEAGLRRCGKSCRLRWLNYLRPGIKRGNFSEEEEESIFKLHEMLGNRWSAIAKNLPGRTDNEIKNAWHAYLKKRTKYSETLVPDYDSSEFSSFTDLGTSDINNNEIKDEINSCITVPQIDESYQSNKLAENMDIQTDLFILEDLHVQTNEYNIKKEDDGIDFWYKVLIRTGGLPKVSEL